MGNNMGKGNFNSDTHQSQLHPQVIICDEVVLLTETPKILDTHLTFGPHAR